jgi:hypothetical protein
MTKPVIFRCMPVFAAALILNGLVSAPPQSASATPKKLGQLEITLSKVEQYSMVADTFNRRTTSSHRVGLIDLRFKNLGDIPICATLVPSVEEYKGTEWQYTQPIKTGFAYNPKIEKLRPGAETTGYYDFRPSPQQRDYVLVLQQLVQTQKCGNRSEHKNATTSDAPSVRFSLSERSEQQ